MRLIHKLKQVAEIDVEQYRGLQSRSSPKTESEGSKPENLLDTMEKSQISQTTVKKTSRRTISPPRRPLTRSQSGYVSKRRPRDDSPLPTSTVPSVSRKRFKATNTGKQSFEGPEQTDDEIAPEQAAPTRTTLQASVYTPTQSLPSPSCTLTFLDGHENGAGESNIIRRNPRSRVVLPIPVPNLTKKSRGRRVPTNTSIDNGAKERRLYVCNVEGCEKCFLRGEHLKRHIRSIHTHDKPFKCTFQKCEKMFNRHDNLLQHLKVHREPAEQANATSSDDCESERDGDLPHECESEDDNDKQNDPDTSGHHMSHNSSSMTSSLQYPNPYQSKGSIAYPTVLYTSTTRYAATPILPSESPGFSTNMAVSSIRTEMPSSPLLRPVNKPIKG